MEDFFRKFFWIFSLRQKYAATDLPNMHRTLFFLAAMFINACALSDGSGSSMSNCDDTPRGDPTMYPLAKGSIINNVIVAAPQFCAKESSYIRIERKAGGRRIGITRSSDGGFDEGCKELPESKKDILDCPVVNYFAVLQKASQVLRARGVLVNGNGIGMGPCGELGEYEVMNMALGVVDWADAEQAVILIAQLLDEYDLKGYIGVAVVGMKCVKPL